MADVQPTLFRLSLAALLTLPARLCNPPLAVARVRSCSVTPVFKVTLDDVLERRHLPPLGLKDFEEWLLFVEQSAENLYFVLWLREYAARYNQWAKQTKHRAVAPPPPNKNYRVAWPANTSHTLALFYARAKQTFFTPNSEYELVHVPSDLLTPFHTATFGSPHPDPEMFADVEIEVRKRLKESLQRFVFASYHNVGSPRAICGMVMGTLISVLGALPPILVNFVDARSRWLRLCAVPGLWLGLTILIGSLHGVCLMVYIFGDVRQLRQFELQRPAISRPKNLRSTSLATDARSFALPPHPAPCTLPPMRQLADRPPRIMITIPDRAVLPPPRPALQQAQRRHRDRRVRSQLPGRRSVSTPSLSYSLTPTTTTFTIPDSVHDGTIERNPSVDRFSTDSDPIIEEFDEAEEADTIEEEEDEDNGIYVSPAYRPEDEDLEFGLGFNYGTTPADGEDGKAILVLPAPTSPSTLDPAESAVAGPSSPISPSDKEKGTAASQTSNPAILTASFIHPYQDPATTAQIVRKRKGSRDDTSGTVTGRSTPSSLPDATRAQPLSPFDFDALPPSRPLTRRPARHAQSLPELPAPTLTAPTRNHFIDMIPPSPSPMTPLHFAYPASLNQADTFDLEKGVRPSRPPPPKPSLLGRMGMGWHSDGKKPSPAPSSTSTSTLNVETPGFWGAVKRAIGYKQEKCARCVTERVLRGSGVTIDPKSGNFVPPTNRHSYPRSSTSEDEYEVEEEEEQAHRWQPTHPQSKEMVRYSRQALGVSGADQHEHETNDDGTHGAGCPPGFRQRFSSRTCPHCGTLPGTHPSRRKRLLPTAKAEPMTPNHGPNTSNMVSSWRAASDQRPPIFGPVTKVHSPIVSRAQWEVTVRSFILAGIITWAVIGGLVALPEMSMASMLP